jgi:hypothetical protein
MRQTANRLSSELTAPSASSVGALVRRLAIAGFLLAALTILASIALAS